MKNVDMRFRVKTLIETNRLTPVDVGAKLQKRYFVRFLLMPIKAFLTGIVLSIASWIALDYVGQFALFRYIAGAIIAVTILLGVITVWHVVDTAVKILRRDYGFYESAIVDTSRNGYQLLGIEDGVTLVLFGRKDYTPGEKVLIARMGEDLRIISE